MRLLKSLFILLPIFFTAFVFCQNKKQSEITERHFESMLKAGQVHRLEIENSPRIRIYVFLDENASIPDYYFTVFNKESFIEYMQTTGKDSLIQSYKGPYSPDTSANTKQHSLR